MKLVTFIAAEGSERWGAIWDHPGTGESWAIAPPLAADALRESGIPVPERLWAPDLAGHLADGEDGRRSVSELLTALDRVLVADAVGAASLLSRAGWREADVQLLAPIPRPRLCWGLVANSPSFMRGRGDLRILNLMPLGHQRPQGSIVGAGADVVMTRSHHRPRMGFNVELAVVIGKGGRDIALGDAMDHVAGYTVVTDIAGQHYFGIVPGNDGTPWHLPAGYQDWLYQATASWGGKIADAHCPVGPYLITRDEIENPYDLLLWVRQGQRGERDTQMRDRAHTGATILGIERVIEWYSSFATLSPGDIIHFGTMGVDGLPIEADEVDDVVLESEIERLGVIRNPVRVQSAVSDPRIHPAAAVRAEAERGAEIVDARSWSPMASRHFYTSYGNHSDAPETDGLPLLEVPRFLLGPSTSLGSGGQIHAPARAADIEISIELAIVLARLTGGLGGDAPDAILGFAPLVSLADGSFADGVVEPSRPGERGATAMYARWADGFNAIGTVTSAAQWRGREMRLEVGGRNATGTTSAYRAGAEDLITAIGAMTTLFPGDVITLGATSARIRVSRAQYESGIEVRGSIDGLGEVRATIRGQEGHLGA